MKNIYMLLLVAVLLAILIFMRGSSSMTPEKSIYSDVQAKVMGAECPAGYKPLGPTLCVKPA